MPSYHEIQPLVWTASHMNDFIEGMRVAWISDPEGNIVELNQGYTDETNPPPLDR